MRMLMITGSCLVVGNVNETSLWIIPNDIIAGKVLNAFVQYELSNFYLKIYQPFEKDAIALYRAIVVLQE